jgi:hypothetical protein
VKKTRIDIRHRSKLGREFEGWERSRWIDPSHAGKQAEAPTEWKEKRGRIDLRLVDLAEGHTVLVEIKASDWDAMTPHRVRPNALRHARQLWRYIEAELAQRPVLPAIVYPIEPITPGRKEEIESALKERFISVVWRELDLDSLSASAGKRTPPPGAFPVRSLRWRHAGRRTDP